MKLPPHGTEVFVGGIPQGTTEDELKEAFSAAGEVFAVSCACWSAQVAPHYRFALAAQHCAALTMVLWHHGTCVSCISGAPVDRLRGSSFPHEAFADHQGISVA